MAEWKVTERFLLRGWWQWPEVFYPQRFNWVEFVFIQFDFEYEKVGPQFEIHVGLLGFRGDIIVFMPWKTEQSEQLQASLKELQSENLVSFDEAFKDGPGESSDG